MKKEGIHAFLIPSSDPHQNEYVPEFWQRRKFISGFTGSAGDVVITLNTAGLWTDSRYFLQAEKQLDPSLFTLFKIGMPGVPELKEWLKKNLKKGEVLGLDPELITHREYRSLVEELAVKDIGVKLIEKNLIDLIWEGRPAPPEGRVELHDKKYAGETAESKLKRLREKMAEEGADAHIITTLDAVAWLFNIRGRDVAYNPVAIASAVVTSEKAMLFIDPRKIPNKVEKLLGKIVEFRSCNDFEAELRHLSAKNQCIWLDESTVNQKVVEKLKGSARFIFKPSPIAMFKAVKNKVEINGFRKAHIRDGKAMVKFLHWLERSVGKIQVTELRAAAKAAEFRAQEELFRGLSFETISSYRAHGAVVHYAATPETDIPFEPDGIYLIDSGGQYLDGTTDITRTVALGRPTEEQKILFTRVLKGLINLSMLSFPLGTAGKQLDTVAREPLWEIGLNYGHGTGHGVGTFLNVHEGPQAISYYRCIGIALEPGMITTIEPGYYKENEYGIRLENMVFVVKDEEKSSRDFTFYRFETLTLCPIDLRLVQKSLLTEKEIEWLNSYHQKVYDTLSPLVEREEREWLKKATEPL